MALLPFQSQSVVPRRFMVDLVVSSACDFISAVSFYNLARQEQFFRRTGQIRRHRQQSNGAGRTLNLPQFTTIGSVRHANAVEADWCPFEIQTLFAGRVEDASARCRVQTDRDGPAWHVEIDRPSSIGFDRLRNEDRPGCSDRCSDTSWQIEFQKIRFQRELSRWVAHLTTHKPGDAIRHCRATSQQITNSPGTRAMMVFKSGLISEQSGCGRIADKSVNTLPCPLRL
jgi:hypothetical protein